LRSYSQDTVIYWPETGNKQEEGRLIGGKKQGLWKFYDLMGILNQIGEYTDDKKNGTWEAISSDGKVFSKYGYRDDVKNGRFMDSNYYGGDSLCGAYNNGRKDGAWYGYNEGKIIETKYFKDGRSVGTWKKYYPTGELMAISFRKKMTLKQYWEQKIFFKDGTIKEKNFFDNNSEASGTWLTYSENGRLIRKAMYKNGCENGCTKEYYNNGKIKSITQNENGKRSGLCILYYDNGRRAESGKYVVIRSKEREPFVSVKTGQWFEYYPSGNLKAVGVYYPDYEVKLDSIYTHDSNNTILHTVERIYIKDKNWNEFSEDGKKKIEEFYDRGKLISRKELDIEIKN
jgi:antitoxin component YwqK of YwqJK toxin-antitoxin module